MGIKDRRKAWDCRGRSWPSRLSGVGTCAAYEDAGRKVNGCATPSPVGPIALVPLVLLAVRRRI